MTAIQQKALGAICDEIRRDHSHSGGDFTISELLARVKRAYNLTDEETRYLDQLLVKFVAHYQGAQS